MIATGPLNALQDGIAPLTGVIEAIGSLSVHDELALHAACSVRFERGEPFCRVFPVPAGSYRRRSRRSTTSRHDPELLRQYQVWQESATSSWASTGAGDAETIKQAWQRFYSKASTPTGSRPGAPTRPSSTSRSPRICESGGAVGVETDPMDAPDYEIVVSTENIPYLLWQALLFHASCVQTQGVAPTIVVHGDGRARGFQGARRARRASVARTELPPEWRRRVHRAQHGEARWSRLFTIGRGP